MKLEIPAKLIPLARELRGNRYRHIILKGGRGSGKSWSIGGVLVVHALAESLRVYCFRETQKSIKQSSMRMLGDVIDRLGLAGAFDVQEKQILGPNRSEFQFAGLKDHTVDSIKSAEGFDIAWVEEAHSVSARSANILIPTMRKPGSKLVWSYNPDQEGDFVHQLANSGREDVLVLECNWQDNPWFPHELEIERRALQAINTDLYDHVWGGQVRSAAGLLFKRHWFNFYDVLPRGLNLYIASDYACGQDPDKPDSDPDWTEHGVFGLAANGDLYVVDWWYGQDDPSVWIDQWLGLIRKHKPLRAFEEMGVIRRALDASINTRMRETRTFIAREGLPSAGGKAERALGFAARASAGAVYLPSGQDWSMRLLNQLCAFNGQDGRQDDVVDVCSLLARGLDQMAGGRDKPPNDGQNRRRDYSARGQSDDAESNWKVA